VHAPSGGAHAALHPTCTEAPGVHDQARTTAQPQSWSGPEGPDAQAARTAELAASFGGGLIVSEDHAASDAGTAASSPDEGLHAGAAQRIARKKRHREDRIEHTPSGASRVHHWWREVLRGLAPLRLARSQSASILRRGTSRGAIEHGAADRRDGAMVAQAQTAVSTPSA
jgi:hypothetical protein